MGEKRVIYHRVGLSKLKTNSQGGARTARYYLEQEYALRALHLLLCKGDQRGSTEPEGTLSLKELAAFLESVLNQQHGFHLIEDSPLHVNSLLQEDESIDRGVKSRALLKNVPGKAFPPHFLSLYCIFIVKYCIEP